MKPMHLFSQKDYKTSTCKVHIYFPIIFIDLTGRIVSWSLYYIQQFQNICKSGVNINNYEKSSKQFTTICS